MQWQRNDIYTLFVIWNMVLYFRKDVQSKFLLLYEVCRDTIWNLKCFDNAFEWAKVGEKRILTCFSFLRQSYRRVWRVHDAIDLCQKLWRHCTIYKVGLILCKPIICILMHCCTNKCKHHFCFAPLSLIFLDLQTFRLYVHFLSAWALKSDR